jgi:hypothetical protein
MGRGHALRVVTFPIAVVQVPEETRLASIMSVRMVGCEDFMKKTRDR